MSDPASSGNGSLPDGVVTKVAVGTVAEVATRFRQILEGKGVTVFAVVDQAAAAQTAGLSLRDTVLVIFGNPAAGTCPNRAGLLYHR